MKRSTLDGMGIPSNPEMKLSLLQSLVKTDMTIHDATMGIAQVEHLEALDSVLFSGCETDNSKLRAMCATGLQVAFRRNAVNAMKKTASVIPSNMDYCDTIHRWISDVTSPLSERDAQVTSEILKKEMAIYENIKAMGRSSLYIKRMKDITKSFYKHELTAGNKRDASIISNSGRTSGNRTGGNRSSVGLVAIEIISDHQMPHLLLPKHKQI